MLLRKGGDNASPAPRPCVSGSPRKHAISRTKPPTVRRDRDVWSHIHDVPIEQLGFILLDRSGRPVRRQERGE